MVGSIGASGRPGQRIALPLAAALCLHGVLALVLISWKPPPVGKPAAATEIFFVSLGREALPKSAQPAPAEEPPQRQAALTPCPRAIENCSRLTASRQTSAGSRGDNSAGLADRLWRFTQPGPGRRADGGLPAALPASSGRRRQAAPPNGARSWRQCRRASTAAQTFIRLWR